MPMKAKEFVEKAIDIAKNHKTLYVMGCFGAPLTETNKTRYINNGSANGYNAQPERAAMIRAASADTFGFDCVCLIKGIMWGWCGDKSHSYGGAKYNSNGVSDQYNADGMIGICRNVTTDFSKIEVGEAVWCKGHIGIYIGDGLAVESTPAFANKVQITAVKNIGARSGYSARRWTKHGKLPFIIYGDTSPQKENSTGIRKGDQVHVNSGAKTYSGGALASFVYRNTYDVLQVSGDRVVIGVNGQVTAAVNARDLTVV